METWHPQGPSGNEHLSKSKSKPKPKPKKWRIKTQDVLLFGTSCLKIMFHAFIRDGVSSLLLLPYDALN